MSQPPTKKYPAAFKDHAGQLAVESEQSIAQTARDLGGNETPLHTWSGKYHRAERQEQQGQGEHLYEELKRLWQDNARLKEERERLNNLVRRAGVSLVGGDTPGSRVSCRSGRRGRLLLGGVPTP